MYDESWQPTCEQQDGASVGAMRSGASLGDGYSLRLRTRRAEEVACGGSPGRLVPCEACDTGCVGSSRLRSVRGVRTPTPLKRGDAGECPLSLVSPCIGCAEPGTSRPTELYLGTESSHTAGRFFSCFYQSDYSFPFRTFRRTWKPIGFCCTCEQLCCPEYQLQSACRIEAER